MRRRVALMGKIATGPNSLGHSTVLVDIDEESVVLHDPYFGASRRLPHKDLLDLWQPRYANAEIVGNMLIAIAEKAATTPPCSLCGTVIPPAVACAGCGKAVSLEPAVLLGCVGAGCSARLWNYICCPLCDHTWTFSVLPAAGQEALSGSEEDPWNLNHLFGELDKFCEHILSSPDVARRPDVQQQLELLRANKDRLRQAQADELVHRQMSQAQLAQARQQYKEREEALLKKREAIAQPTSALDGDALAQALLKDLGLLH
jgi:hypothetical protein